MNHSANDAEDKNNSNMTATTNTTENNPRRRHNQPLSRSLILAPKVSLIDNTLAHGYSLKRARGEIILNKSKSDSMIHTTKRMKLQSSYDDNNTTVIISSTNLSASISCSLSSSSAFAKVDPEGNLCPYSFIDSLYRTSSESESSSSSPPRPPLLSKRTTQPLEDTDFHPPTPEQIEAYSNDAVSAVRSSDVDSLRELLSNGHSLQCCNRFGESLLHVACRRSNAKIVAFLLHEANVSPCIRDDYGRTVSFNAGILLLSLLVQYDIYIHIC